MPQLEQISTYAGQVFWLAVIFGGLLLVMTRVALPRIQDILQERQERIDDDLARAEALRDEARELLRAYEAGQAEARARAREVAREAHAAAEARRAERHAELDARLAREAAAAEGRIGEARRAALAGIDAAAGELALAIASRLAGVEADAAGAGAAVAESRREAAR